MQIFVKNPVYMIILGIKGIPRNVVSADKTLLRQNTNVVGENEGERRW